MDAAPHFLYIVTSVGATRKNNMLMKQIEDYVAPAVEVIEVIGSERFCVAVGSDEDKNEGNGEDMPWG